MLGVSLRVKPNWLARAQHKARRHAHPRIIIIIIIMRYPVVRMSTVVGVLRSFEHMYLLYYVGYMNSYLLR